MSRRARSLVCAVADLRRPAVIKLRTRESNRPSATRCRTLPFSALLVGCWLGQPLPRFSADLLLDPASLSLADRLRTIIDYSKILVLGAGEVLEFDTPANLLEKDDSVFADLCRKSGEYDELREIAMATREASKA